MTPNRGKSNSNPFLEYGQLQSPSAVIMCKKLHRLQHPHNRGIFQTVSRSPWIFLDVDDNVVSSQDVDVAPEWPIAAVVDGRLVDLDQRLNNAGIELAGFGEGKVLCELDRGFRVGDLDMIWEDRTGFHV